MSRKTDATSFGARAGILHEAMTRVQAHERDRVRARILASASEVTGLSTQFMEMTIATAKAYAADSREAAVLHAVADLHMSSWAAEMGASLGKKMAMQKDPCLCGCGEPMHRQPPSQVQSTPFVILVGDEHRPAAPLETAGARPCRHCGKCASYEKAPTTPAPMPTVQTP